MALLDLIILAVIQGITEFLPISSSGHLVLWPLLTGRPDQGVTMDVAVHLGTLIAITIFFRTEIARLVGGGLDILRGRIATANAKLSLLIVAATIPVLIAGLVLKLTGWNEALRSIEVIGWATWLGGVLLWLADRFAPAERGQVEWRLRDAVLMGLAQMLALVPGTSRSGITMTMARFLGFRRTEAAKLALLMSAPVILAAGGVEALGVIRAGNAALGAELIFAAALSCLAALIALRVMMAMFSANWTMTPFVLYRLALGVVLLGVAYG